jgi:outer membrane immunogenic protein
MLRRIREFLLAGVSLAALAGSAMAADMAMPVKAPPPPIQPPPTWTGAYAGLDLGWIGNRASTDEVDTFFSGFNTDMSVNGIIGGGLAGYNWQVQSLVLGVEGDISGASGNRTVAYGPYTPPDTFSSKITWLSTIRGRAGVAFDPWLIYGTAGWAFAGVDNTRTDPSASGSTFNESGTRSGFVWGGGVERMLGRNWTARVEALHVNLGSSTVANNASGLTYITRFANTATIVRGGVTFKW